MILREFYQTHWRGLSDEMRRERTPGPFLLINWPVESNPWNRRIVPLAQCDQPRRRELVIGRTSKSDIAIREAGVSSRHALLQRTEQHDPCRWLLLDLCSTNGTYCDRQRLVAGEPLPLADGQSFIVGTEVQVLYLTYEGLSELFDSEDSGGAPSPDSSPEPAGETQRFNPEQLRGMMPNPGMISRPEPLEASPRAWKPKSNKDTETSLRIEPVSSGERETRAAPRPAPKPVEPKLFLEVEGHEPVELTREAALTVGRSSGNDVRLNHPLVSRRHVRVTRDSNGVHVEDLGSANGTIVGTYDITGKRVSLDGSRSFWIGPFCLKVVPEGATSEPPGLKAFTTQLRLKLDDKESMGITFSGSISPEQPVTEVFQNIEFNEKTGTLFVEGLETQGLVTFDQGRPTAAQSHGDGGVLFGEEAIFQLLKVCDGEFSFARETDDGERNVSLTVSGALMEFARWQDERGRGGA